MVKIAIIEDNAEMMDLLCNAISKDSSLEIVAKAYNGLDAVSVIEKHNPDIALLDIVLPDLDGFGVMNTVKSAKETKYLVLSGLSQEVFVSKALKLGASYYMIKPFDAAVLCERIHDVAESNTSLKHSAYEKVVADYKNGQLSQTGNTGSRAIDEKISNIFIAVGIPAHIKGYQFLREAIKLTIDDPDIINSITKRLYPTIASHFNSSPSKVERGIRHAIEISWNRGKIENINTVFGVKIYTNHDKPTNGEFIALVADKLLIEGA